MGVKFEWNSKKAASNLSKHGVTFDEALTVFTDPVATIFDDEVRVPEILSGLIPEILSALRKEIRSNGQEPSGNTTVSPNL